MLCGSFEKHGKLAFDGDEYHNVPPNDFQFGLFDDDWDHFEPMMDDILKRCPFLETAEVQMVNGPESFTVDMKYLCGDVPELFNYYVAAGMNSSGIASSCGVGKLLSNWIIHGDPTYYDQDYTYRNPQLYELEKALFSAYPRIIDIKRFHPYLQATNVVIGAAREALSDHVPVYDQTRLKTRDCLSAVRGSPVYHYQKYRQNARFVTDTNLAYSVPAYFAVGRETNAGQTVSEQIDRYLNHGQSLIFDRSVNTKWLLTGKDAHKLLQSNDEYGVRFSNDMQDDNGVCSMIVRNKKTENIEWMSDAWRLSENQYLLQSTQYQSAYLNKQCVKNAWDVQIADVSNQYCIFHISGKNALDDISKFCHSSAAEKLRNLGEAEYALKFEWIDIGSCKAAICGNIRDSQSSHGNSMDDGMQEWQILVPSDYAPHLYELLCESSLADIEPAGYWTFESLRIQSGIPKYNVDFDATYLKAMQSGKRVIVKGEYVANESNDGCISGGEPILNESKQYIGNTSSVAYCGKYGHSNYFIASIDADGIGQENIQIRAGESMVSCKINPLQYVQCQEMYK